MYVSNAIQVAGNYYWRRFLNFVSEYCCGRKTSGDINFLDISKFQNLWDIIRFGLKSKRKLVTDFGIRLFICSYFRLLTRKINVKCWRTICWISSALRASAATVPLLGEPTDFSIIDFIFVWIHVDKCWQKAVRNGCFWILRKFWIRGGRKHDLS